jgi:hypothetical protein
MTPEEIKAHITQAINNRMPRVWDESTSRVILNACEEAVNDAQGVFPIARFFSAFITYLCTNLQPIDQDQEIDE